MNAHRLTAPREFMGTVDATHERVTPVPRTLQDAFGRAAGGVVVPMADEAPKHTAADVALYVVGAIGAVTALAFNNWGL